MMDWQLSCMGMWWVVSATPGAGTEQTARSEKRACSVAARQETRVEDIPGGIGLAL